MAQNMKLSIITPAGDRIILTLNETETFRQFQTKVLEEHHVSFDIGHFIFESSTLSTDDNLYDYLKNYVNCDEDGNVLINDQPLFEIDLSDNNETEVETTVKNESSPFEMNDNGIEINNCTENYYIDSSLIQDQTTEFNNVLSENIFESPDFQPVSNNKTNSEITLYGADDSVLITDEYPLIEAESIEETAVKKSPDTLVEKHVETSYNYMDIESKLREIHDYNEESVKDFCRLCAGNVKEKTTVNINCNKLEERINFALPINVASEDTLPQQLCERCVEQVQSCFEFVNIVHEADKILRLKFISAETTDQNLNSSTEFMTDFLTSSNVSSEQKSVIPEKQDDVDNFKIEYMKGKSKSELQPTINCRICDLVLDTVEDAIIHSTNEHHIDNIYACPLCEFGFESPDERKEHIMSDHKTSFRLLKESRKSRTFQCDICLKKYATQIQLQKHSCVSASTNKTLHCEICNKSFPTKVRLNFHRQFHLKDARPLYCAICNITFDDENEYFDHVNFKHESKQAYLCGVCGKTFNNRIAFNDHRKQHSESRNHQCTVCPKSFLDHQTLLEHEVSHMTTSPYQCDICGKNLNRLSRLKRHLLTHESNPVVNDVHNCVLCKEVFADNLTAVYHQSGQHDDANCIVIISTDKVFRCEFCEKCFSTAMALNIHRTHHSGLTPYNCHICKMQFSTYARCTSHKTTHGLHKDGAEKDNFPVVKHFLCEQCGKSYLHWSYLSLHRRLKHLENTHTYKCNECNIEFSTSWSIAYHRKTKHNLDQCKCQKCGKVLSNQQSLRLHRLTQHSNKRHNDFKCNKCGKMFVQQSSLDTHLKLHQGISDFKCLLCPKSFVHPAGLSSHMKHHQMQKPHQSSNRSILRTDIKQSDEDYAQPNTERPYTCDECGLSFKRLFTLKNHKLKHKQTPDTSSYVLMVDMKEDCNEPTTRESSPVMTLHSSNGTAENMLVPVSEIDTSLNYIDIGNGNYLQVMGSSLNIVGADDKIRNTNQAFEMIVDETLREEEPVIEQQYDNNTVLLLNTEHSRYVLKPNEVNPQYTLATNMDIKLHQKSTPHYVIENEYMLETDDPTF